MSVLTAPNSMEIEGKLRRAWRKEHRYFHVRGICLLLMWLIAFALVNFLVDWLFQLPGSGRIAVLSVEAAVLLGVIWSLWLRYLRRYDPVRMALQVEKRHPGLQSLLVSYVQLKDPKDDETVSRHLLQAMRNQAVEFTRKLDFREILSYAELKRIFIASACILAMSGLVSVAWKDHVRTFLARMLDPHSNLSYPTRTRIEPLRDVVVRQGETAKVLIRAAGVVPADGTLMLQPEKGDWQKLPLKRSPDGTFVYAIQDAYRNCVCYARIGDAVSNHARIIVVQPPRLERASLTLHYPEYTGVPDRQSPDLSVEVPEGTELRWNLRIDRPLASAQLLVHVKPVQPEPSPASALSTTRPAGSPQASDDEVTQAVPMKLDPDGRGIQVVQQANKPFTYQFVWVEREHSFTYTDEVRHGVQVLPDGPPEVEIILPTGDQKATLRKKLDITYTARDDYGIAKVYVAYSINNGKEVRYPLALPPTTMPTTAPARVLFPQGDQRMTWVLRESIPDLKEGDAVTYAIEVEDNYPGSDGPHRARSSERSVNIVSVAEYQQYIFEQLGLLMQEVKDAHKSELDSSGEVKDIKDQPALRGNGPKPPETRP
ncbi:MAG: DUF4175 family protein [Tepidisphaerales bacterium]